MALALAVAVSVAAQVRMLLAGMTGQRCETMPGSEQNLCKTNRYD